jgi:response regulator RpfG family c-di-GMP phosphodiesterase
MAGPPFVEPERQSTVDVFACLARAGRFRDEETAEHVERMSRTCELIGGHLGLSEIECVNLRTASTMHDIGKIGVPDAVLRKPGTLTRAERGMIERHPEIGYQILTGSTDPVMQLAAMIALTHHERVDGRGYPRRLRGARIPMSGRIAAVADVFDALTHDRPYRVALSTEDALTLMNAGRGDHFDPVVLEAFEAILPCILEIRRRFPDTKRPAPARRGSPRARGVRTAVSRTLS